MPYISLVEDPVMEDLTVTMAGIKYLCRYCQCNTMTREVILPFSPKILPTTASNDEIEWSGEHSFYSNWSVTVV